MACSPMLYYQVYNTNFESGKKSNDSIIFSDQNCKLLYCLWDDGGNIGFRFINLSDSNIYLDLGESFFVLNGIAFDYYKNRIFESSTNKSLISSTGFNLSYINLINTNSVLNAFTPSISNSTKSTLTQENSVSYIENKIVCIPPKTAKNIAEYYINNTLFRDCDLLKYPKRKEIKTISFNKNNSPFVFSNIIKYYFDNKNTYTIKNNFWVSEITNMPKKEFENNKYKEYCDEKSLTIIHGFKDKRPDNFYLSYKRGTEDFKH
jgi:hypothetical protein